jgi:hypothetical protein
MRREILTAAVTGALTLLLMGISKETSSPVQDVLSKSSPAPEPTIRYEEIPISIPPLPIEKESAPSLKPQQKTPSADHHILRLIIYGLISNLPIIIVCIYYERQRVASSDSETRELWSELRVLLDEAASLRQQIQSRMSSINQTGERHSARFFSDMESLSQLVEAGGDDCTVTHDGIKFMRNLMKRDERGGDASL